MKNYLILIVIALFILSCSDEINLNEPNENEVNTSFSELSKIMRFCINNDFPPASFSPTQTCGIKYECSGSDVPIIASEGAKLWSSNVTDPNDNLGCDFSLSENIKSTDISVNGYFPSINLTWGFVFCHKYVIQKRIALGLWQTVKTYDDCKVTPRRWYIDEVAIRSYDPGTQKLEYRILTEIYGNTVTSNTIVLWKIM